MSQWYWITVKEGIMVNEGRNEQWMNVKEGIMRNEGRNEYLPNTDKMRWITMKE